MRDVLKSIFDNDYPGYPVFLDKVLRPIFGEELEVLPVKEDITSDIDREALKKANIKSIYRVAQIDSDTDVDIVEVFDVTLEDNAIISRSRVGIQRIIRSRVFQFTHAFMLFHYDNPEGRNWRFSYAYKRGTQSDTTEAKRYTYLFGKNLHCRTAIDRFVSLAASKKDNKALLEAFSVEALSDEFFDTYRKHYAKFVRYITGKEYVKEGSKWVEKLTGKPNEVIYTAFCNNEKKVRDYVKKLMGRITFLHFLQRKGWMCGDYNFMLNLFRNSDKQDDYLNSVLEPLFFGILNTKPENRIALFEEQEWDSSLLKGWSSIPYLNGGLFEADEEDYLSIVFPKEYFSELFKFYSEYNFTVDENDPDDAEVGVDPEMLGKIFENLLEDNKDKGAFYTPKEIVRYMCQESLIAYLVEKAGIIEGQVRAFVTNPYEEAEKLNDDEIDKLFDALVAVKICDPAIGSGAFPMGLLNELVRCEEALVLGKEENRDRAQLKREIIKNNIYGVDIEKGAIDIARLRFWLSLVVDEDTPSPLPNLDYKIMQGNSLLESYKGVDLSRLTEQTGELDIFSSSEAVEGIQKSLRKKLSSYYSCTNHTKKQQLQNEIKSLIKSQVSISYPQLDLSDIDVAGNQDFFLWHTWFSDVFNRPQGCNGFDIVIGNPPYIKEYTNRDAFNGFRETSPYYMGKMDIWYGFACHSIDLLNQRGVVCFIAQNNWTTSSGAKKLRYKVLKDTRISQLLDFNTYMVFSEAGIQTMVMIFSRDTSRAMHQIDLRTLLPGATKDDMIALLNKISTQYTDYKEILFESHPSDNPLTFSGDEDLLGKIKRNKVFLTDDEVAQGIVFPQDFLDKRGQSKLGTHTVGDGIFGLSMEEYLSLSLNDTERALIKPYYTTVEIKRYYTEPNNHKWLIYTDSTFSDPTSLDNCPTLKAHLDEFQPVITSSNKPYGLHRARKEHFFKGEKIVSLRKCVGSPCFSYSDFDCYVTQTFFVIQTSRWDLRFLTGLLNSKLIAYWLKKKGKMQGDNYQVDKEPLIMIPLPSPESDQESITSIVSAIIDEKRRNPEFNTLELEKQIDRIVYELYGLDPSEISIIESN